MAPNQGLSSRLLRHLHPRKPITRMKFPPSTFLIPVISGVLAYLLGLRYRFDTALLYQNLYAYQQLVQSPIRGHLSLVILQVSHQFCKWSFCYSVP